MIHGRKDNDLREDSRRKCRVLGVWRGELRNGNGCFTGRHRGGRVRGAVWGERKKSAPGESGADSGGGAGEGAIIAIGTGCPNVCVYRWRGVDHLSVLIIRCNSVCCSVTFAIDPRSSRRMRSGRGIVHDVAAARRSVGHFVLLVVLHAGVGESRFDHSRVLERESLLYGGFQLLGGCEDDLDVFDHRGGVEVVDVLRPGAAEGEAQGAERPDADAVALLQQGGDTVAYEVHRSLQFGGGHGGVACHGPGDGPGVEAVHGGGDGVPFSGFVSLVRIFFER